MNVPGFVDAFSSAVQPFLGCMGLIMYLDAFLVSTEIQRKKPLVINTGSSGLR